MMKNELNLLKTRRFLPLFLTQFLGAFNDNVFKNALAILLTYKVTQVSNLNASLLVILSAGLFILPFFIFSGLAGQLADKYEKAFLIRLIKFSEILLSLMAAYGFYTENYFLLFASLFGIGSHSTFFGPLKYAILPDHLKPEELLAGNGYIEAGTFLAILSGTLLGGLLILTTGGEYLISSILILVAIAGFSLSFYIPRSNNFNPLLEINLNIFKETVTLIKYSTLNHRLFLCILGISWFWLVGSIFLLEFPALVKEVLHADEKVVTLFLILFSIGLALGSILCNRLLKGKANTNYVPLGMLGMMLFTFDFYFTIKAGHFSLHGELLSLSGFFQSFAAVRISFDLILIAFFGGLYTVPLYAILQKDADKAYRARVIASNNVMNALLMVLGVLSVFILTKMGVSIVAIFLLVSILNALAAIYICKLLPDVLIKQFFKCLLRLCYRVEIKGLEHYPQGNDRFLVICNHTSFIDALLLATFLPEKLTFAVNTLTAKKWWIKGFLRLVEAYPVDPLKPMAIKSLIELVQQNKRCVIFPEGRLTVTGGLMKIYEGPGLVADKAKAKLLPIHIEGAQFTPFSRMKGKIRIRLFPKITIRLFPTESLVINTNKKGRERRTIISNKLYDLMSRIQFESRQLGKTLFEALIDAKQTHGANQKILEDIDRHPLTYQQVLRRSLILGSHIAKRTNKEEYLGVLLPNMVSTAITLLAMQAYSRVPALLNYSSGIKSVLSACRTANIKRVYTSERFIQLAKLTEMVAALEKANIEIIYLEKLRKEFNFFHQLKGAFLAAFPKLIIQEQDANQAAVLLFTSGSEGKPKGVVLSHQNIQANRYQLAACIDFTASDRVLNALPLFHSFGLTAGFFLPLLSGINIFLYPSPLHYRIIPELSYDTNATILFGTNTFLAAYAKYAHPYDFYSLRYVFAGAEKLKDETKIQWAEKFGIRIFEGYGATETSPVISINTPMHDRKGSVGRLLPGIHYQITPVPGIQKGGVLSVKGPNVMKGYLLADTPGILQSYKNKWYDTGDIVSIDDDGFLTIEGRLKRFAKIAGEMISLTMVEQHINQLWPTHQHAVIALPDDKKGEQIILLTTHQQASREELIGFYKQGQMGELALPKKILNLTKMPLLGSGKIDYEHVKQIACQFI